MKERKRRAGKVKFISRVRLNKQVKRRKEEKEGVEGEGREVEGKQEKVSVQRREMEDGRLK